MDGWQIMIGIGLAVFLLCCVGVVAMMCRVAKMSHATRESVAWQHVQLAMGFAATPVVWYLGGQHGAEWALLTLAASMVAFVLLGASRWRDGAPQGTLKDGHGNVQDPPSVASDRSSRQRVPEDRQGGNGAVLRGSSVHAGGVGAQGSGRSGAVTALRVRGPR